MAGTWDQQLGELSLSPRPQALTGFNFPKHCHLLVTTPSHIYAWDYSGIHPIFQSSKNGIVAAREAPNGSGVLAVADKHVVVIHDTRHGQEKSWGLGAATDEVRQLQYTSDAKSLYLSTSLTADIQRYSTEFSRLLDPARTHPSPPVALAISPIGRLMLSASDGPPVVYLQSLEHNSSPLLIEPRASRAAVAVAAFHPERPNIFLLAFRDGTAAAYDATRLVRSRTGSISNQESVNRGEVCHLTCLHRAAATGGQSSAIADAAFLPGFKWRAVTVGNDGRCRIIDFADGGVTLRTWHAKGPVTSVSVQAMKLDPQSQKRIGRSTAPHVIGGPTSTDSLIAIGRSDGEVLIYDSVGLLLSQRNMNEKRERILSVEWIKGPSPRPVDSTDSVHTPGDAPQAASGIEDQTMMTSRNATFQTNSDSNSSSEPVLEPVQPSAKLPYRNPSRQNRSSSRLDPPRKFTIHPDEAVAEADTIRRTPAAEKMPRMTTGDFQDLFSPSKVRKDSNIPPHPIVSPSRARPSITDQTFVKSPEPGNPAQFDIMARRRNLALFPSTDSKPESPPPSQSMHAKEDQGDVAASPLSKPNKRSTSKITPVTPAYKSPRFRSVHIQLPQNLAISTDLGVPGTLEHSASQPAGLLGYGSANLNAVTPCTAATRKKDRMRFFHRPVDHIETDADSETAREAYEHVHTRQNWPEDSIQESSGGGDGCVTSSIRKTSNRVRTVRPRLSKRQSLTRNSRYDITSRGIMNTTGNQTTPAAETTTVPRDEVDGSTEEDIFVTADTHMTSSGTFSPSSKDVCALFPRSSSLSPRKKRRPKPQAHLSAAKGGRVDKDHTKGLVIETPSKSPWVRARGLRTIENGIERTNPSIEVQRSVPYRETMSATDGLTESSTEVPCATCRATHAKVLLLEADLARLKGEITAVKTKLKRHCFTLPVAI